MINLLISITTVIIAIAFASLNWYRRRPYALPTKNHINELGPYALLSAYAYNNPAIAQQQNVAIVSKQYRFELIEIIAGGKFWLWSGSKNGGPAFLVVAVRGSQLVTDFIDDAMLATSTATGSHLFDKVARESFELVWQKIHAVVTNIVFTGHSLGASIAESLWIQSSARAGTKRQFSVFTFDSPGLPNAYLASHNMTRRIPEIVTVNSSLNIVNALNQPTALEFYVVNGGAQFKPKDVITAFGELLTVVSQSTIVLFAKWAFQQSVASHPMDGIIAAIEKNDLVAVDPSQWPALSGILLTFFSSKIKAMLEVCRTKIQGVPWESVVTTPERASIEKLTHLRYTGNKRPLPTSSDSFVAGEVYVIEDMEMWKRLPATLNTIRKNKTVLLLPFVGHTQAGKSSTINALLRAKGLNPDIPSSLDINGSIFPFICLWQETPDRCIFLLDMPGVGAATRHRSDSSNPLSPFVLDDYTELFALLKGYIGAAVFVVNMGLDDNRSRLYSSLLRIKTDLKVCVAYNRVLQPAPESRVDEDPLHEQLNRDFDGNVVRYHANQTSDLLRRHLERFLEHNFAEICAVRVAHWKARKNEERAAFIHRIVKPQAETAATVGTAVTALSAMGSGFGAWSVGAPAWISVFGTVGPNITIGGIGLVGAVPVASVVLATAAVAGACYGARHIYTKFNITKASQKFDQEDSEDVQ